MTVKELYEITQKMVEDGVGDSLVASGVGAEPNWWYVEGYNIDFPQYGNVVQTVLVLL